MNRLLSTERGTEGQVSQLNHQCVVSQLDGSVSSVDQFKISAAGGGDEISALSHPGCSRGVQLGDQHQPVNHSVRPTSMSDEWVIAQAANQYCI